MKWMGGSNTPKIPKTHSDRKQYVPIQTHTIQKKPSWE